jgi:hypothetical protein
MYQSEWLILRPIKITESLNMTYTLEHMSVCVISNKNMPDLFQTPKKGITDLSTWFKQNKLSLSLEKTQYTIFPSISKQIPETYDSIQLNNTQIHRVNSVKYLGMIIDATLTWDEHITCLKKALTKQASSFKIIRHFMPNRCKKRLYHAYTYSKIQYGIEVYGCGKQGNVKQIQVLQNKILKTLFNLDWLTPTIDLHKNLKILTVKDIHNLQLTKFVYKYLHNDLPPPFDNYFTLNCDTHNHHTRYNQNLHIDRTHSTQTTKVTGANAYNNIPEAIRTSGTLKTFASNLKKYLIGQY